MVPASTSTPKWFEEKYPKQLSPPDYIANLLNEEEYASAKPTAKVVWLGKQPLVEYFTKSKKGNTWEMASLTFHSKQSTTNIKINKEEGAWLANILENLAPMHTKTYTLQEVKESYENAGFDDFELFWDK